MKRLAQILLFANLLGGLEWACGEMAVLKDSLSKQVTIYRDEFGVPHIVGETEPAVFFGYGYAQAQDHLERMMLQYRDAQGRRAEIQGEEALGDNYLHRWGRTVEKSIGLQVFKPKRWAFLRSDPIDDPIDRPRSDPIDRCRRRRPFGRQSKPRRATDLPHKGPTKGRQLGT